VNAEIFGGEKLKTGGAKIKIKRESRKGSF
jgi:hypothetical protein